MIRRWRREWGKWIKIWVSLDGTDGAVASYCRSTTGRGEEDSLITKATPRQIRSSDAVPLDQATVFPIPSRYRHLIKRLRRHLPPQAGLRRATHHTRHTYRRELPSSPLIVRADGTPSSAAIPMQMMRAVRMSSQLFKQMRKGNEQRRPGLWGLGKRGW